MKRLALGLLLSAAAMSMMAASAAAQTTTPAATTPAKTAPRPAATSFVGVWSGKITQVGRSDSYPVVLTITAKDAKTEYANQDCTGKLTRIGASGNYVFYAEKITKGAYDEASGNGCIDGTLTLYKSGSTVMLGWVGGFKDQLIMASGTLSQQKPATSRP